MAVAGNSGEKVKWLRGPKFCTAWALAACLHAGGAAAFSPDLSPVDVAVTAGLLPALSPGPALPPALASASADARYAFQWVMEGRDNHGLPFVIVDKRNAQVFVFDASGHLRGASAALLGLAPGDASVPDMQKRSVGSLSEHERTTPAGRFESEPGHNLQGEAIVWIDYDAKLALHRLRPAAASELRPERLASASTDDNRISMGCVIVPTAFYDAVVEPLMSKTHGVVYVLPETQAVQRMLDVLQYSQH